MIRTLLTSGLLAAAALAAAMPAQADPPPWAPAHGYRAQHHYIYYPAVEVYYEPATSLWFWFGDGNWQFGVSLPVYFRQYTVHGVTIDLDVDRPYVHHTRVVEYYGGKNKKGKHKSGSRARSKERGGHGGERSHSGDGGRSGKSDKGGGKGQGGKGNGGKGGKGGGKN